MDPLGWAIILVLAGCALVVLEVFIPSGGLLGFLASVIVVAGIVMAFRRDMTTGLTFIVISLIALPTVVGLAFKYWPMTPMGRAFLGEIQDESDVRPDDPRRSLVGRVGIARSKMLPAGAVEIDGDLLDCVSDGTAIDPGQKVVVVQVRGNRVVVRPALPDEAAAGTVDSGDMLSRPIEELGLDDPMA